LVKLIHELLVWQRQFDSYKVWVNAI